jgi:hypothetical protein
MGITNDQQTMEAISVAYTFRNRDWITEKYYIPEKKTTFVETSVIEAVKFISNVA